MAYKVIQWSTGNVGRHAVRLIVEHPELELVGLWVHSEEKTGRDAGELVGMLDSFRRRPQVGRKPSAWPRPSLTRSLPALRPGAGPPDCN